MVCEFITNSTGERIFTITDTKLYVPLVTLSTHDTVQCNHNNEIQRSEKQISSKCINAETKPVFGLSDLF